jgi:hypothetical protein
MQVRLAGVARVADAQDPPVAGSVHRIAKDRRFDVVPVAVAGDVGEPEA